MYEMRFPDEKVSSFTMQQLRGREGARIRRTYREHAARTGIKWSKRDYNPIDFTDSDLINQALSAATTCLYGVVNATVVALGCSPGLGFIHTGHDRSFVYDIADLYKAELAIPTAFDAAAQDLSDLSGHVRRTIRDRMHEAKLLERCVHDIKWLLIGESPEDDPKDDILMLWDDKNESVPGGVAYGSDEDSLPW
jgi:CRISPR-associated protein Cas1